MLRGINFSPFSICGAGLINRAASLFIDELVAERLKRLDLLSLPTVELIEDALSDKLGDGDDLDDTEFEDAEKQETLGGAELEA